MIEALRNHRTFRALKVRDFRLFFFGQISSVTGNNAQNVGMGWLVLDLTHNATVLGLVLAAQFVPVLVLSPLLGSVVDRFEKRHLLMTTQLCSIPVALALGVLAATDHATALIVGVLAFLMGVVNALDSPARQTFVHDMVGAEMLSNAVALYNVLVAMARIAGPAIAGVVIATAGIPTCFFLNAASFLVLFACMKATRTRKKSIRAEHSDRPTLRSGIAYVLRTPEVSSGLLIVALVGTFTYEYWVTLPVLARDVFHRTASGYAALMTVMSIGSVIGGITMAGRSVVGRKELLVCTAAFGGTTMLVGLAPSIELAFAAAFLMGTSYSAFVTVNNSVLQLCSDIVYRGRVMSLWSAGFIGSTAIGGPIMGWLSHAYGARVALVVGGGVAVVTATAAWLRRRTPRRPRPRAPWQEHLRRADTSLESSGERWKSVSDDLK